MTVTATVAGAIAALANFAMFFGGGDDRERPGGIIGTLALMILAPMAAGLVQMAISRGREYEADRVGAEIAGDAAGARLGPAEDRQPRAPDRQYDRRAQSGIGAAVHHQPAGGSGGRQSVLDPSGDR